MNNRTGLVHIYAGNGKGKTTAAVGLAVRARGSGLRVLMLQFLKGRATHELEPLRSLGVQVERTEDVMKFYFAMTESEQAACRKNCIELFELGQTAVREQSCDLLILDEVLDAVGLGIITEDMLCSLLQARGGTEVVLTGRNPGEQVVALADYFTQMDPVKHPYERGIQAREGIEF